MGEVSSEIARESGVICGAGAEPVHDNEIMKIIKNTDNITVLFVNKNCNSVIFPMSRK